MSDNQKHTIGYRVILRTIIWLAVIGGTLLTGWVLTVLWAWFVSETFGTVQIGFAQALGLILLSRLVFSGREKSEPDIERECGRVIGVSVLGPLVILGIGWILHQCIITAASG